MSTVFKGVGGVLALMLVFAGCAGALSPGEQVGGDVAQSLRYLHDDARGVGCWFLVGNSTSNGGSIPCLADKEFIK